MRPWFAQAEFTEVEKTCVHKQAAKQNPTATNNYLVLQNPLLSKEPSKSSLLPIKHWEQEAWIREVKDFKGKPGLVAHISHPSTWDWEKGKFQDIIPSSGPFRYQAWMLCINIHGGKTPTHIKSNKYCHSVHHMETTSMPFIREGR